MSRPPDPPMNLETARWLTGAEAAELLEAHADAAASVAAVTRLRRVVSAERAAAVLEQVELRRRAAAKFREAGRMLFTRKGLEQATDAWVAEHKAARLAGGGVADLCCGLGGDLMGFRSRGDAIGVERDAASALLAEWNSGAAVRSCDADDVELEGLAAWHCDPDRRASGRRTTRPESHEPSLATLDAWRGRNAAAAIKLAPAAVLPDAWLADCELEWVSRRGECRQLVAWCGPLAAAVGERRATRVFDDAAPAASVVGDPSTEAAIERAVGAYVYEPDAAVIAARLVGVLAARRGLRALSAGIAYLTGDTLVEDPLLAAFAVEERLPLDRKRLAAWLAERRVGRLEIKVRGVRVDPEQLRRELRPRGDNEATLLVAPDPNAGRARPMVIVARRAAPPALPVILASP